jgi:hypothetical protein
VSIIGTFESGIFGAGYFGWAQQSVAVSGSLVSDALMAALAQETENAQMIGVTVSIGGVDVSESVQSVLVSSAETRITTRAEIILIGDSPSSLSAGASIEIGAVIAFEDGTTFTNNLFSGVVTSSQPSSGSTNRTVVVSAYDSAEALMSAGHAFTTWTGTASGLVALALEAGGVHAYDLDIDDYSMTAATVSAFQTLRDLVLAVAGGKSEVVAGLSPNGLFWVKKCASAPDSGLIFGAKAYTYFQRYSDSADRYKAFAVTGTGTASGTATGTGKLTDSLSTPLLSSSADCAAKAQSVVDRYEADTVTIQIPLNPLVKTGTLVTIEYEGADVIVRVTGVSHSVSWTSAEGSPGAWTTITGAEQ